MKSKLLLSLFFFSMLVAGAKTRNTPTSVSSDFAVKAMAWEENKGQLRGAEASTIRFFMSSPGLKVGLAPGKLIYQFETKGHPRVAGKNTNLQTHRIDLELVGANMNAAITPSKPLEGLVHYYNHNILDVVQYQCIKVEEVYPNIDWVIYTTQSGLKYDFVVKPGGDPSQIRFKPEFADHVQIDEQGDLVIHSQLGAIREDKPVSFQQGRAIETRFTLKNGLVGFQPEAFDPNIDLVIDPEIIWSSYYGGEGSDIVREVSTDLEGNVFICGDTYGSSNLANGGFLNTNPAITGGGAAAVFLVKFGPDGNRLWATYYGSGFISASGSNGLATDALGNVYLCGTTDGSSNIAINGHQNTPAGGGDAFLVKFNSSGQRIWGTFYGGSESETGFAVAVDAQNNVYLAGETSSSNGIAANGDINTYQSTFAGTPDAFLVKFAPNGARLWGTYFGGTDSERGFSVSVGPQNEVYLAGLVRFSTGLGLGGHQNAYGGGVTDAFLAKYTANGQRLWSTYYGGNGIDEGSDCAVDVNSGDVYLCGLTQSPNQIFASGFQSSFNQQAAFLVKFSTNGQRQWGTYFGGGENDQATAMALDGAGNVFLTGYTTRSVNIAFQGFMPNYGGMGDGFLVQFSPSGARLWASYFGGNQTDFPLGCHADASNQVYIAGNTQSPNLAFNGFQSSIFPGATEEGFVAKLGCANAIIQSLPATLCAQEQLDINPLPTGGVLSLNGPGTLLGTQYTAPPVNAETQVSLQYSILANGACEADTVEQVLTLLPLSNPQLSISASSAEICEGDTLDFISTVLNSGNTFPIQWLVNSTPVAQNQGIFSSAELSNGDLVSAILQNTESCALSSQVNSNTITVVENPVPALSLIFSDFSGGVLVATPGFASYQWFVNGQLIPGASASNWVPQQNGLYTVVVSTVDGCSAEAEIPVFVLGFSTASLDDITVFPNPSSDFFQVSWPAKQSGAVQAILFDLQGRQVWSSNIEAQSGKLQIPAAHLSEGFYTLQLFQSGELFAKPIKLLRAF